ncbi:extracellular solute-binding protein [Paenibacillus filicis]|uniref:Extracellular solute-binding protein n=1 Tax=Paenibacillus gyeongsangnamensis TaxID=3388067 RepID=A0ABT4QHR4_9BACL|nr:extracellular solute-binding protein [Paenibacillus filicis]MCZ8516413.1 extracellular solute-binding protein [Paenibacillus filicis]
MKRISKKLTLAALSTVIGLSLTGCGGASSTDNKTASASGADNANKQIKLRISWWGSQPRHDATLKILDLYKKKNPNVTFESEYSGFDGYIDKLTTEAAAKNAPDIIQLDAAWLADWNARGLLADLSSVNLKDMDASLADSGKYKGKQTTVPIGKNAWGIVYDKGALDKLGLQMPKDGITWDDFFKLAREAKQKLGKDQYVLQDMSSNWETYWSYQLSQGKGYAITPEGKFNYDKDTYIKWVNIFSDLRKEGVVPPADVMTGDKELDPKLDLMINGKIIFRSAHAAQASSWDSMKPGSIGVAAMPKAAQAGGWLKATFFFGVSQDSKYREEAAKFVDWFINDPEAGEISGTTRGVPVSSKILAQLQPKFTPADKLTVDMIDQTASNTQKYLPTPKGWDAFVTKDYKSIGEALMFGKTNPEQAYNDLKKKSSDYEK